MLSQLSYAPILYLMMKILPIDLTADFYIILQQGTFVKSFLKKFYPNYPTKFNGNIIKQMCGTNITN